jgi:hypothetical protein
MLSLLAAETGPIAARLAGLLLGIPAELAGKIYLWTQHDTVALDRLVNLTHLQRLPNAASSTRSQATGSWPFTAIAPAQDPAQAGADVLDRSAIGANIGVAAASALTQELLAHALDRNDYRRFTAVVNEVSGGQVVDGGPS